MNNDIDVVFFDLFFTLTIPQYNDDKNENDVLGITREEWETYAEDNELYLDRAIGKEKDLQKIIESIVKKIDMQVSESQKKEILELREKRFKKSLVNIDPRIINVLLDLKISGKKLCLISNADIIDVLHWKDSKLSDLFDYAIFSYEVGYLKPQKEIYQIALKKMNTTPQKCIFVGDGGSNELKGAKELGINTILTEYLLEKEIEEHNELKKFADYYIRDFKEITYLLND